MNFCDFIFIIKKEKKQQFPALNHLVFAGNFYSSENVYF